MFRDRARAKSRNEILERPLRLITTPALLSLSVVVLALVAGGIWLFGGHVAVKTSAVGVLVNPPHNEVVATPVSGIVVAELPPLGTRVVPGQTVAQVRTAGGGIELLHAPVTGTVVLHWTGHSAPVKAGDVLLTIAPATGPMAALLFMSASQVGHVAPGIEVEVAPSGLDTSRTGVLMGTVAEVSPLPAPLGRLQLILGDDALVAQVTANGPVHEIIVEFVPDPAAPLGLRWTGDGPDRDDDIISGAVAVGQFVIREQRPWQALLGVDAPTPTDAPPADSATHVEPTGPQELPVTGSLRVDGVDIGLEVARTPSEQETGLMFRTDLRDDRGMVFELGQSAPVSFWMKNILIPLDLIYVRENDVVAIASEAQPCEENPCPTYPSGAEVDLVIEIAAGRAAELGIEVGDTLELALDIPPR